jgi:hypothetical protein
VPFFILLACFLYSRNRPAAPRSQRVAGRARVKRRSRKKTTLKRKGIEATSE